MAGFQQQQDDTADSHKDPQSRKDTGQEDSHYWRQTQILHIKAQGEAQQDTIARSFTRQNLGVGRLISLVESLG